MKTQWTIATFNLWGFNNPLVDVPGETEPVVGVTKHRIKGVDALLRGEDADIIGLQETSTWEAVINEHLMDRYAFAGEPCYYVGGADCNIIYKRERFELLDTGFFYLHPEGQEARGWDAKHIRRAVWAVLKEKATGIITLFATTHLEHDGPHARLMGAKMLAQRLEEIAADVEKRLGVTGFPIFLVGDMNDETYTPVYQALTEKLLDARKRSLGPTVSDYIDSFSGFYYAPTPLDLKGTGHFIDHVLFRGDVRIDEVRMIYTATNLCPYGKYVSDHNAVICRVSL